MIKKIYFVQQKKYYGRDDCDGEDIDERMIIGYFTSSELVDAVKRICIENGIPEREIDVQCFDVDFKDNQKYVYSAWHLYSVKNENAYTDYEYVFPPQSNRKKCAELIEKLKLNPKYAFNKNRIYENYAPDGFGVNKYKLNCVYYPIVKLL